MIAYLLYSSSLLRLKPPSGSIVALLAALATPTAQSSHRFASARNPDGSIVASHRCRSQPRRLNRRIASLPLALLVSLVSSASLHPPQAALSFGSRFASLLPRRLNRRGVRIAPPAVGRGLAPAACFAVSSTSLHPPLTAFGSGTSLHPPLAAFCSGTLLHPAQPALQLRSLREGAISAELHSRTGRISARLLRSEYAACRAFRPYPYRIWPSDCPENRI